MTIEIRIWKLYESDRWKVTFNSEESSVIYNHSNKKEILERLTEYLDKQEEENERRKEYC